MDSNQLNRVESRIKDRRKNLVARELYRRLKPEFDWLQYSKKAQISFCEEISKTLSKVDQDVLDTVRFVLSTHKREE